MFVDKCLVVANIGMNDNRDRQPFFYIFLSLGVLLLVVFKMYFCALITHRHLFRKYCSPKEQEQSRIETTT